MGGPKNHLNQPNSCYVKEKYKNSFESELVNLFVECKVWMEHPMAQGKTNICESRFKLDILKFQCCL
jgi:hypothetical protein